VAAAAHKRELPFSEEEMQTVRTLVKRMTTATDHEQFRALIVRLRRIVEHDPSRQPLELSARGT